MAKLSSASIRLVQKLNRQMKDGTYPIYLVVCFKGRVEKKTGVSCLIKDWDSTRECVKRSCPNSPVLNKILSYLKGKVIERKNEFEYEGKVYTPSLLLQDAEISFDGASNVFKILMDRLIEERRLRYGTIRSYDYTFAKLCEFLGRKDFIVDELILGVVKDFAAWMERNNIKINTIKRVLSCVAAVWNYAISRKIVNGDNYPFLEFKYAQKYKEVPRDYYLEKSHIVRLKEYWLNLVIERNGKMWKFKDGALERLQNRCSREWGILWFLLCYRYGGAAPADVAYLRPSCFERVWVDGVDYWKITFKRKKTDVEVKYIVKRDLFSIVTIDHYLGFAKDYVYPVLHWKEGCSDKQLLEQVHHCSDKAIKWVREAFSNINEDIARDNANGGSEPIVEVQKLVLYVARHSRASQYLNTPNATVSALASMMGRSTNCISTYIHRIQQNKEIVKFDEDCAI